jgi:ketosteroid isomerase-like protein
VASAHARVNDRDLDDLTDIFDPGVVLDLSRLTFNPAVYRGYDGVREWVSGFDQTWSTLRHDLVSVVAAGEQLVAHTRLSGRGLRGGVPVDMDMFGFFYFRAERIVQLIGAFNDLASATAAAAPNQQRGDVGDRVDRGSWIDSGPLDEIPAELPRPHQDSGQPCVDGTADIGLHIVADHRRVIRAHA